MQGEHAQRRVGAQRGGQQREVRRPQAAGRQPEVRQAAAGRAVRGGGSPTSEGFEESSGQAATGSESRPKWQQSVQKKACAKKVRENTHMNTFAHARAHMHAHMYTRTHTHTLTCSHTYTSKIHKTGHRSRAGWEPKRTPPGPARPDTTPHCTIQTSPTARIGHPTPVKVDDVQHGGHALQAAGGEVEGRDAGRPRGREVGQGV